jgi:putative ABC transport system permease protein
MVGRRVEVTGIFSAGTSFGIDGAVVMSDANFFRLMPGRSPDVVNVGLIKLKPGYDADRVRAQLAKVLPNDVRVLTHSQLNEAEREFWSTNTPIGFIFALGVGLGLVVGIIIVYQILYTDVTDHLQEYATLKAIGYKDRTLFTIIIFESVILSVFGYIPGFFITLLIYRVATNATFLPLRMTAQRGVVVYLLTIGMCVLSGALALRRLRRADPAEIF